MEGDRSLVDEEAVADHRETQSFCPHPLLILIKGPLQDKQPLPTLEFTQPRPAETRVMISKRSLTSLV